MKYTVITGIGNVLVEADGHFFANEDAAKGYLVLVNGGAVVAAFKEYNGFVVVRDPVPAVDTAVVTDDCDVTVAA